MRVILHSYMGHEAGEKHILHSDANWNARKR